MVPTVANPARLSQELILWLRSKPQYSKRQVVSLVSIVAEHHGMKKRQVKDLMSHVDPAAAEMLT